MRYPITPVPKPRMTQRDKWRKRACVLRYRAFKDKCRLLRVTIEPGASVVFHLPMPRTWPESARVALEGRPHTARPDLDNLVKALLDAVLREDAGVWALRAEKRWARAGAIEVRSGG